MILLVFKLNLKWKEKVLFVPAPPPKYIGSPVVPQWWLGRGQNSGGAVLEALINSLLHNLVLGGGDVKIENQKLNFKEKAQAKVGSLDNVGHLPAGGTVKVGAASSGTSG